MLKSFFVSIAFLPSSCCVEVLSKQKKTGCISLYHHDGLVRLGRSVCVNAVSAVLLPLPQGCTSTCQVGVHAVCLWQVLPGYCLLVCAEMIQAVHWQCSRLDLSKIERLIQKMLKNMKRKDTDTKIKSRHHSDHPSQHSAASQTPRVSEREREREKEKAGTFVKPTNKISIPNEYAGLQKLTKMQAHLILIWFSLTQCRWTPTFAVAFQNNDPAFMLFPQLHHWQAPKQDASGFGVQCGHLIVPIYIWNDAFAAFLS